MRDIRWLVFERRRGQRLTKKNWKYPDAVVGALKEFAAREQVGVVSILVTLALTHARFRSILRKQPGGPELLARYKRTTTTAAPASTPKPSPGPSRNGPSSAP